jgi:hypothetical protein
MPIVMVQPASISSRSSFYACSLGIREFVQPRKRVLKVCTFLGPICDLQTFVHFHQLPLHRHRSSYFPFSSEESYCSNVHTNLYSGHWRPARLPAQPAQSLPSQKHYSSGRRRLSVFYGPAFQLDCSIFV